ncbi:MAG: methylmalonyl Co-A mutase-associated GTPase MeaB [Chloroflexi bacterium]|nr:methylmalonyl Co-A mutase-associated GTPase MeaB [Chloroflexota bacterium]
MTRELIERLLKGDRRALARLLSLVENGTPEGMEALRRIHRFTGQAGTVGITGATGSGKSTLVSQIAKEFHRRGKKVGIIAVDPSSPFTQGALLGDRVRMQELCQDEDIFVRSMASRGALGGLAETTMDAMALMDAFGKEVILVETVGAGQDEVAVVQATRTTVVLLTPGTGDDVQMMKAGLMEIGHIYVVNKSDREGAPGLTQQLNHVLSLAPSKAWNPPVLNTVATTGQGIAPLVDAIQRHWKFLAESGLGAADNRQRIRHHVLSLVQQKFLQHTLARLRANGTLESLVNAVTRGELDPQSAAEKILDNLFAPSKTQPSN